MWAPFWQPFLLANNLSVWQVSCKPMAGFGASPARGGAMGWFAYTSLLVYVMETSGNLCSFIFSSRGSQPLRVVCVWHACTLLPWVSDAAATERFSAFLLQDTVAAAAPRGWELEITDVSIGSVAPELSGFQALADPDTGAVVAVDCQMSLASKSVKFAVVGRGPLGSFTAKVSAVSLEGEQAGRAWQEVEPAP
jgi:hypothetical protein